MEREHLVRLRAHRNSLLSAFYLVSFILFLAPGVLCFAGGRSDPSMKSAQTTAKTMPERLGGLITAGKIEDAKSFFISEMQPNDTAPDGKTAAHYAALARNSDLADFFIRLGTHAGDADSEGNSPLNISAVLNDEKTAAVFVRNNASIHHKGSDGGTPAQLAVKPENSLLLDAMLTGTTLVSADENGNTILHLAADIENLAAIDTIIRAARDSRGSVLQTMINRKNSLGRTALDLCFSHRNSKTAASASAAIITAGGSSNDPFFPVFAPAVRILNYNLRASNGISPLHYAVRERYSGWTDYLLEKKADPNIKSTSGDTPLIEAARIGDVAALRMLINAGAQVNTQDAQGNTAMHIAIPAAVHHEALQLLLDNNGNPNIRDMRGDSPAHIVIDLDRPPDVLEILLSRHADVSIHNIEGKTPLFVAVEKNRMALIPLLLNYRSDIFAATNDGVTPFEKALQSNSTALDQMITDETVQRSDNGGNTLLLAAVRLRASADIVRRILDKNAAVNARNQEGDTALHLAVRQNDAATGELLLSRGADVFLQNAKGESPLSLTFFGRGGVREWMFVPSVLSARDGQGRTILHLAAEWKLDQVIPVIVSRGAIIDAQNVLGETPLFVAVRNDSASTVRALLQAGAALNGRDTLGNTALHTAVRFEANAAAEALINAKIDINAYNLTGNTPLHEAVRLGKYSLVNLLVQRGANSEMRDAEGNTPLMCAVTGGNFRIADHLVRANADVNARNNEGATPLIIAVQNERSDLVALLLDHQAQIHARDADGESPFTTALRVSHRMVLSLLSKGRDQTDDEGRSPLHIALMVRKNEAEIEAITGWVGIRQLNVVDREGRTPLRYAVDMSNWEAAKFLTDQGANVYSVARDGKTPAEIALATGNREAVRALFGGKAIAASDQAGNTALHYAARLGLTDIIFFLIEMGAQRDRRNTSGETAADIANRWGNTEAAATLR
ncbi:MAG: ankyrin repeat domain-containing protein [Spirochaetaceae bacterium]|nr:ankyrin repeat domain-containing protein [Spirochaetaceae bacterium]